MRLDQIDKLYSQLTAQQQANLLFEAVANGNSKEADAIEASVEQKTYRSTDLTFHRQLLTLHHLVGAYSQEYWRLRALLLYYLRYDNAEKETAKAYLDKMLALEFALVQVCQQLKVEVKSVKTMACCLDSEDNSPVTEPPPAHEALVKEYSKFLSLN